MKGYDLEAIKLVSKEVNVPVIAVEIGNALGQSFGRQGSPDDDRGGFSLSEGPKSRQDAGEDQNRQERDHDGYGDDGELELGHYFNLTPPPSNNIVRNI